MKTSLPHFIPRIPLLAALSLFAAQVGVNAQEASTPTGTSAPITAPLSLQYEAMGKYPELARAGSPFNQEYLKRVRYYLAVDREFFQNARWPVLIADEVAARRLASVARPAPTCNHTRLPLPSGPEWRFLKAYREGNDIVVPHAVATVFGWDTKLGVYDPDDNGKCASGRGTRHNPGIVGCALPVSIDHRSTAGSPFARIPNLPWFSSVVVTHKGKSITVQLIDNGPSAPARNDPVPAGIDLTPAACVALGISLDTVRANRLAIPVSFRVVGAGRQLACN